jgi:hypothetical protein
MCTIKIEECLHLGTEGVTNFPPLPVVKKNAVVFEVVRLAYLGLSRLILAYFLSQNTIHSTSRALFILPAEHRGSAANYNGQSGAPIYSIWIHGSITVRSKVQPRPSVFTSFSIDEIADLFFSSSSRSRTRSRQSVFNRDFFHTTLYGDSKPATIRLMS